MWNCIWFIMAFWTLIKDSKCKKYFYQHRYSLSQSAFSIAVIIPLGYKLLCSISFSNIPCEDRYFNLFSGDVHKSWKSNNCLRFLVGRFGGQLVLIIKEIIHLRTVVWTLKVLLWAPVKVWFYSVQGSYFILSRMGNKMIYQLNDSWKHHENPLG